MARCVVVKMTDGEVLSFDYDEDVDWPVLKHNEIGQYSIITANNNNQTLVPHCNVQWIREEM